MVDSDPDKRTPEETARIRDEALKRALTMPPMPKKSKPKTPKNSRREASS